MKTFPNLRVVAFAVCAAWAGPGLKAQPVTDWHTFKATPATTLSGQGTSSPVFGTTTDTASQVVLIGYLGSPLSLLNVGDKITFTFNVSFNDAAGMAATTPDQFRFALFESEW